MPNGSENWTPDQLRFQAWLALPKGQRVPKTQQQLAKEIGVHQDTLTDWKKLPGFFDAVNQLARELVKHDVAEVLGTVRREAKRGNLPYVNMVLSMAGLAKDLEAAGKGPGSVPVREVVVMLRTDEPLAAE